MPVVIEPYVDDEPLVDQQNEEEWSWVRPVFHGTGSKAAVYNKLKFICQLFKGIQNDIPLVAQFRRSAFGAFYDMNLSNGEFPTTAIHALLGRQITFPTVREDELWFKVGPKKICFSRVEFALVTGLRFGPTSIDTTSAPEPSENGLYRRWFNSSQSLPLVCDLLEQFSAGKFRLTADGNLDHLKVMKILFVYIVLIGGDDFKKRTDKWIWTLIDDDDRWESFPWGTFAFQLLIEHISAVRTDLPRKKYHVYGCTLALLFWAFEAIPRLGVKCAKPNRNSSGQRPRILKWELQKRVPLMEYIFIEQSTCFQRFEITPEERKAYSDWWSHMEEKNAQPIKLRMRARKKPRIFSPPRQTLVEPPRLVPIRGDTTTEEPIKGDTTTEEPIRGDTTRDEQSIGETTRVEQDILREVPIIGETSTVDTNVLRDVPIIGERSTIAPLARDPMMTSLIESIAALRRENTDSFVALRKIVPAMVQVEVDRCFSLLQQRIPEVVEEAVSRGLDSRIPTVRSSVKDEVCPEIARYINNGLHWVVRELKSTPFEAPPQDHIPTAGLQTPRPFMETPGLQTPWTHMSSTSAGTQIGTSAAAQTSTSAAAQTSTLVAAQMSTLVAAEMSTSPTTETISVFGAPLKRARVPAFAVTSPFESEASFRKAD